MNLFIINTDLKDGADGAENLWLARGVAVTSGGERYRKGLQRTKDGDLLALYVNELGIAAVGRAVGNEVRTHRDAELVNPTEQEEYHRDVVWQYDLRDAPISVEKVAQLRLSPRRAISKVHLSDAFNGLLAVLADRNSRLESDRAQLEQSAAVVQRAHVMKRPAGSTTPRQRAATGCVIDRDPAVKAWSLRRSRGLCECCGNKAPFVDRFGLPFLESHHIVPLGEDGPDTPWNTASVCPNCHRELHHGPRKRELTAKLSRNVLKAEQKTGGVLENRPYL